MARTKQTFRSKDTVEKHLLAPKKVGKYRRLSKENCIVFGGKALWKNSEDEYQFLVKPGQDLEEAEKEALIVDIRYHLKEMEREIIVID